MNEQKLLYSCAMLTPVCIKMTSNIRKLLLQIFQMKEHFLWYSKGASPIRISYLRPLDNIYIKTGSEQFSSVQKIINDWLKFSRMIKDTSTLQKRFTKLSIFWHTVPEYQIEITWGILCHWKQEMFSLSCFVFYTVFGFKNYKVSFITLTLIKS